MFPFKRMKVKIGIFLYVQIFLLLDVRSVEPRYLFSDEDIRISAEGILHGYLRVISENGITDPMRIHAQADTFLIQPEKEGIYILQRDGASEVRYLVMDPPQPIDSEVIRKTLPLNRLKLLGGEPFRLLSMGDSVTATGDYEGMLKMMLTRATGNKKIEIIDRSYSGRSVDASVRNYKKMRSTPSPTR